MSTEAARGSVEEQFGGDLSPMLDVGKQFGVVDVLGRAVGGLLDLLDTDQVTWYQIIHESDAQAFSLLTSIIVLH